MLNDVRELFDYDASAGTLTWRVAPDRKPYLKGKVAGTKHLKTGYSYVKVRQKRYPVHRVVWWWANGPLPDGMELDHINGARSDNRLSNLRLVSRAHNCANTSRPLGRTGYRGVSLHRKSGLYRARFGNQRMVGYFKTPEAAAEARDRAVRQAYGACARTNS